MSSMSPARKLAPDMAFFHPENFDDEPICCTASVDNDKDILCAGSDDDAYPSAADRLLRYEEQAHLFLAGNSRRILSASLRGPFDEASGWTNPWRSQRPIAAPPKKKAASKRKRAATTTTRKPAARKKKKVVKEPSLESAPEKPTPQSPAHIEAGPAARHEYLDDDKAGRVKEWADSIVTDIEPVASFAGFEEALGAPPRRGSRRKRKASSRRTSSGIPNDLGAPSQRSSFGDASHIAIGLGTPTPANAYLTSSLSAPPSSIDEPKISTPRALPGRKVRRLSLELGTPAHGDNTLRNHDISPGLAGREAVAPTEAQIPKTQDKEPNKQPAAISHTTPRLSPVAAEQDPGFLTCSDRSFRFRARPQQSKKRAQPIPVAEPLTKPRPKRLLAIADLLNSPAPQRNVNNAARTGQTAYPRAENANTPITNPVQAKGPTIDPVVINEPTLSPTTLNLPPLHLSSITTTNAPQIPGLLPPVTLPSIGASIPEQSEMQPEEDLQPVEELQPEEYLQPEEDLQLEEKIPTPRSSSSRQDARGEHVAVGIVEKAAGVEEPNQVDEPAVDMHLAEESEMTQKAISNPSTQSTASSPSVGSARLELGLDLGLGLGLDLGAFSFERQQSQAVISDLASAPRKLLWPKSQPPYAGSASLEPPSASFQLPELGLSASVSPAVPSLDDTTPTPPAISPTRPPTTQHQSPQEDIREHEPEENAASAAIPATFPSSSPNKPAQVLEHSPAHEYALKALEYMAASVISEPMAETEGLEPPQPKAGESSSRSPATTASSPQQSPWSEGNMAPSITTDAVATAQDAGPLVAEHVEEPEVNLPRLVPQSPWARGDSQVTALVKPRPLSPIPSPFSSPRLPEPVLPQLHIPDKTTPSDPLNPPTTPDRQTSSLPTPEFTFSIKSFREFMTPSPPKRRPLAPKSSNGRFPSTQVLEDAAVSNPWARVSCTQPPRSKSSLRTIRKTKTKTKKRVSWGPLPHEPVPEQSSSTPASSRSRPASPPPSSLVSGEDLPMSEQKFAKHFAAVKAARRRLSGMRNGMRQGGSTPTTWNKKNVRLLPSESQQTCPSPAMGAMAEAFLRADEVLALEGRDDDEEGGVGVEEEEEVVEEDTQQSVDDVSLVLDNLDDYLGSWDVETELEKERKESRKEKENRKDGGGGEEEEGWKIGEGSGMSVGLGLGTQGMADELLGRGVWD